MSMIEISNITRWSQSNSYFIPLSADYRCPHCHELANHHRESEGGLENFGKISVITKMRCVRCGEPSLLWCLGISQRDKTANALYLSPDNDDQEKRDLSEFENGVVPIRVLETYQDAIASFDAKLWDAAGTLCGKALEGAVKIKLPPGQANVKGLAAQLSALEANANLSNPFSQVANAIRVGRNVSAHFDENIRIDRDTAKALIELVEYVLEFLYVFELKASNLSARITALDQLKTTNNNTTP